MKNSISIALTAAALMVVGCSHESAPPAEVHTETAPAPAARTVSTQIFTEGNNKMLSATHTEANCETAVTAKITWDITPSTETVEVLVWRGEDEKKVFAEGGGQGSHETGPWVFSNTVFVLQNKENQQELDRIAIPGPACSPEGQSFPANP